MKANNARPSPPDRVLHTTNGDRKKSLTEKSGNQKGGKVERTDKRVKHTRYAETGNYPKKIGDSIEHKGSEESESLHKRLRKARMKTLTAYCSD